MVLSFSCQRKCKYAATFILLESFIVFDILVVCSLIELVFKIENLIFFVSNVTAFQSC